MASLVHRSRAAVLVLGGWGLQTLLHVYPRLRALQTEREALGLTHLPDLNRILSYAAIMPAPYIKSSDTYTPLRLVYPSPIAVPEAFYCERQLLSIHTQLHDAQQRNANLTEAEQIGECLFDAARSRYLEEIPLRQPNAYYPPTGYSQGRVTRSDMFQAGLKWSESVSRAFINRVMDPTRLDQVEPHDTFVQTHLYVIAALTEPMTSALIWPVVSELVSLLGGRNVARVTGLFCAGSFALDHTRVYEEAAAHVALSELDLLTGVKQDAELTNTFKRQVELGRRGASRRVGHNLFDQICIVDREKSNQSLARDAHELAVLAGNVIESYIAADGDVFVSTRLAPDRIHLSKAPYSLLGAATTYVPLKAYIEAAREEEVKEIIRTYVLDEPKALEASQHILGNGVTITDNLEATLSQLAIAPDQVVRSLLRSDTSDLFERDPLNMEWYPKSGWLGRLKRLGNSWLDRLNGTRQLDIVKSNYGIDIPLPNLRVRRRFLIPPAASEILRDQEPVARMWEWSQQVNTLTQTMRDQLRSRLTNNEFNRVWGLNTYAQLEATTDALRQFYRNTWTQRHENQTAVIPHTLVRLLQAVVANICKSPLGLHTVDFALRRLQVHVDHLRERIVPRNQGETTAEDNRVEDQRRLWEGCDLINAVRHSPYLSAIMGRVILLVGLIAYLFSHWLTFDMPILRGEFSLFEQALILIMVCSVPVLPALILMVGNRLKFRRLRQRRIEIALTQLSLYANGQIATNLQQVYIRFASELERLHTPIQQAIATLRIDNTSAQEAIRVPPTGIEEPHGRQTYTTVKLWQEILATIRKLRIQVEAGLMNAREYFVSAWQTDGKNQIGWSERGEKLGQRVRLALETELNHGEYEDVILDIMARQQGIEPANLHQRVIEGEQCPFAVLTTDPNRHRTPFACSACLDRKQCLLLGQGQQSTNNFGIAPLIQEYSNKATAHLYLYPQSAGQQTAERKTMLRTLIDLCRIEHLLFSNNALNPIEYTEKLFAIAKPAANFEMSKQIDHERPAIDFGVSQNVHNSKLKRPLEIRKVSLLTSEDPLSISIVRTVNGISYSDLTCSDRLLAEFYRLNDHDRAQLVLLPAHYVTLYGNPPDDVIASDETQFPSALE